MGKFLLNKYFLVATVIMFVSFNIISAATFNHNGGSTTTSISVKYEWGVISKPNWVSLSPSYGFSGTQPITISCAVNSDTSSRSGTIVIGRSYESNIEISVYQSGLPYYTVVASAGSGGSISPSSQIVSYGGCAYFSITPDSGYYIFGASGGSLSGSSITACNVTSNRSVSVSFCHFPDTLSASKVGANELLSNESISSSLFEETISNKVELFENYPNPFNPTTNIKYSVSEQSHVSLIVYDLLGKEIVSLVNENKQAGTYNVNFDASNLANGTYIYSLRVGNLVQTKKMMLVK